MINKLSPAIALLVITILLALLSQFSLFFTSKVFNWDQERINALIPTFQAFQGIANFIFIVLFAYAVLSIILFFFKKNSPEKVENPDSIEANRTISDSDL